MLLDEQKTIICTNCCCEKPVSEFYIMRSKTGKVYVSNICKECKKARVKVLYYLNEKNRRRKRRKPKNEDTDRTEAQPEFFEVRGRIVYARLMFYDMVKLKWRNEFLPIIEFDTKAECFYFLTIARDLPTGELKRLHYKFKLKHNIPFDD